MLRRLVILLFALVYSLPCMAQDTHTRVAATISVTQGAGFENPIVGAEAGGAVNFGRVVFDGAAHYQRARKTPGGGHNTGARASLRIALSNGASSGLAEGARWFAGPAFSYHRQTTSLFTKTAFALGGEVGRQDGPLIISGRFLQDLTSVNKVRSYEARLEWFGGAARQSRRVGPYVAGGAAARDFNCIQGAHGLTEHCWSYHAAVSVGVWIK